MRAITASVLGAALYAMSASAFIPTSAATEDRTFRDPMIGGLFLDGCYDGKGKCKSGTQASAFCSAKGFAFAVDFMLGKKEETVEAKRLGDGGTCKGACEVMTAVRCVLP